MQNNIIKEEDVNGNKYQFARMEARAGGLVLGRLVKCLQTMASSNEQATDQPEKEPSPELLIRLLFMNLPEADSIYVQNAALATVKRYMAIGEEATLLPVLKGANIAIPDLQMDIATILELTKIALCENLSPFFTKTGLEKLFTV